MSETVPKPDTDVIIGVDTHKLTHTAVAVSALGVRLGGLTISASNRGYQALQAWARSLGAIRGIRHRRNIYCREALAGRRRVRRPAKANAEPGPPNPSASGRIGLSQLADYF